MTKGHTWETNQRIKKKIQMVKNGFLKPGVELKLPVKVLNVYFDP